MSLSGSSSGSSSSSSAWRRKCALLDNLLSSKSAKKAKESEVSVAPPVSGSPSFTDHDIDSELALEDAQKLVDDWVMVLPLDERKQLAVASFVTYRRRQGMEVT